MDLAVLEPFSGGRALAADSELTACIVQRVRGEGGQGGGPDGKLAGVLQHMLPVLGPLPGAKCVLGAAWGAWLEGPGDRRDQNIGGAWDLEIACPAIDGRGASFSSHPSSTVTGRGMTDTQNLISVTCASAGGRILICRWQNTCLVHIPGHFVVTHPPRIFARGSTRKRPSHRSRPCPIWASQFACVFCCRFHCTSFSRRDCEWPRLYRMLYRSLGHQATQPST